MGWLRKSLDRAAPHFAEGKRLAPLHPLYEALDTILYTPATVTRTAAHVRDGLDLKRMMMAVVIALLPCAAMAMYNTGYQSHLAIANGALPLETWQTSVMGMLGLPFAPEHLLSCIVHGALYYLPVLVVTFAVGGGVETGAAILRKHEINEGFLVTGMLFPLILPPGIPLWQVALGIAFGVVFGKEVFGGTGMNFLNPALLSRAFLFFAYPAEISGNVWVAAAAAPQGQAAPAVDAVTGASILTQAAAGAESLADASWWNAFLGLMPGSMGETSALACLLGALLLVVLRIASWRIIVGVTLGTLVTALLLDAFGSPDNALLHIPFHWHLVLGGWAFGTAFMATDPVTSPFSESARLIYGVLIGVLTVLIRAINPAYPEGMMLAILFMNVFAALLDHVVVAANIRRRASRSAA